MKNKLQTFHKKLLKEIEEILHSDWNSLWGENVPKDEYNSYALQILGYIINSCAEDDIGHLELFKTTKKDISKFLSKTETQDMGLVGDIVNCQKVAEKVLQWAERYTLYFKFDALLSILKKRKNEQKEGVKTKNKFYEFLNGRVDPGLSTTIFFIEDLLKIEWEKYDIDNKESFVEELADPIGAGGMLRFCIFHSDKNLKTYTYKKEQETVFLEIIIADEAAVTYPGGHSHGDYYDYATGKYIKDNETIELIKNILEENLIIKYVFRGKDLIGSGVWEEKNQRFWMSYGMNLMVLNPMYWIRKLMGKFEKEREEIVTICWKK